MTLLMLLLFQLICATASPRVVAAVTGAVALSSRHYLKPDLLPTYGESNKQSKSRYIEPHGTPVGSVQRRLSDLLAPPPPPPVPHHQHHVSGATRSKPRAILHTGPHKTGSSTVQSFLMDHRADLERHDIYVAGSCGKADAQFALAVRGETPVPGFQQYLVDRNCTASIENYKTFFSKHVHEPSHTIVISSEELAKADAAAVQSIYGLLRGYDVTIVHFYREYVSRLYSLFIEESKGHGALMGYFFFESWLHMKYDEYSQFTRDSDILRRFASVFGDSSIVVVDYNHALSHYKLEPHQVFACDILHMCEIDRSTASSSTGPAVTNFNESSSIPTSSIGGISTTATANSWGLGPPPSSRQNPALRSLKPLQLFDLFYQDIKAKGCVLNKPFFWFVLESQEYMRHFQNFSDLAPIAAKKAPLFWHRQSNEMRVRISSKYKMLYSPPIQQQQQLQQQQKLARMNRPLSINSATAVAAVSNAPLLFKYTEVDGKALMRGSMGAAFQQLVETVLVTAEANGDVKCPPV